MEFEFERVDMSWLLDMAVCGIQKCGYDLLGPAQLELFFELRNAVMFEEKEFTVKVR